MQKLGLPAELENHYFFIIKDNASILSSLSPAQIVERGRYIV